MTLLLDVTEFADAAHWSWRLTEEGGAFIADHKVSLDTSDVEYQGFMDLHGFLRHRADPGRRLASEAALVDRVGGWLGEHALGPIGPALVERSPVTVQVRVPAGAEALLQRPFELAHVEGRPLAMQDVSLVFEAGGVAGGRAPVGERLRMLAVFSVPTDVSALALRRERYRLSRLVHEIAVREGRALELRVLQYGASRERLREVLEEGEGWDAVHFSGHGLAGGLVLEREDGSKDTVPTSELVGLLRPARERLKLVTLSSCLSAAATAAETLRLLGITPPRAVGARETPGTRAEAAEGGGAAGAGAGAD